MNPAPIRLRSPSRDDVDAITALLRQLGYGAEPGDVAHRLARLQNYSGHRVWLCDLEGTSRGLLHAYLRPALERPFEATVQALVIDTAARGRGLGRRLMEEAERWAREEGCSGINLHTRMDRADARAFYLRLGYGVVAQSCLMGKSFCGG